ncbi:MAG: hypothetical protein QXT14_08950 [Candidatus Bathyarchaeia archaeon]
MSEVKLTIRLEHDTYKKLVKIMNTMGFRTINDTIIYCISEKWMDLARLVKIKEVVEE